MLDVASTLAARSARQPSSQAEQQHPGTGQPSPFHQEAASSALPVAADSSMARLVRSSFGKPYKPASLLLAARLAGGRQQPAAWAAAQAAAAAPARPALAQRRPGNPALAASNQRASRRRMQWDARLQADILAVAAEAGLPRPTAEALAAAARKGHIASNPGILLCQVRQQAAPPPPASAPPASTQSHAPRAHGLKGQARAQRWGQQACLAERLGKALLPRGPGKATVAVGPAQAHNRPSSCPGRQRPI
jgi:hypothetical protein